MPSVVIVVISKALELALQVSEKPHGAVLDESREQGKRPVHQLMSVPCIVQLWRQQCGQKQTDDMMRRVWR